MGALLASSAMENVPAVVFTVAEYRSAALIVTGGAAAYCCVLTRVFVLAGQPAATAAALAAFWAALVATVVVVDDFAAGFLLLFDDTAKTIPTMMIATTATMIRLRICWRRLRDLAWAARRASLAARCRALLSLGTGRHPTRAGST